MLEATFRSAANEMLNLSTEEALKIPQEEKLRFYAYYKQGTIGNVNVPQPAFLDSKANAKWWAWNGVKGMNRDQAMNLYIQTTAQYRESKK